MLDYLSQPWAWYIAGPIIAIIMFLLLLSGKSFGLSANLRTMCSILGAGKSCQFFDFNWKDQMWNLVFALGLVIGGFISHQYLTPNDEVHISKATKSELVEMGFKNPGQTILPPEIFSWENLFTFQGFMIMILGGFLVGFGTRYAGGCTSGHAISGLSDLQLPSLIAVIGFFIGGLAVTYLVLPYLLTL